METAIGRIGDLVLPQGTYVLLQDGANGSVDVVTGPHKVSLADTDKPVIYERESRRFSPATADRAIKVCPAADEGQYIVLTNPSKEGDGLNHPSKGKQATTQLDYGKKINIQGPNTFALYPGQVAEVIDGHQLKSNEYLVIRIYNEAAARQNLKNAVVKAAEGEKVKDDNKIFDVKDIRTGNLLIIKGTDVSFYIPPTGIEVVEEGGSYIRKAVTLERLEYCVLLDQNGDKRYVKGPDVVFPKPTEVFVDNKGKKVFRAIELNDNMGIYIKVIADYQDGNEKRDAGEELFITGKELKIYFPRAEHAIIKYGDQLVHYATAVPAGEGRYVLDKNTGEIKLHRGPAMLLPDPRFQVIVKRVLSDKNVSEWFPGNAEALKHNQLLKGQIEDETMDYVASASSRGFSKEKTVYSAITAFSSEEMERKTEYTKPRSIKLDTKYEGAVTLNIWPNYAVQIVNKTGDRKVVEGPKVVMLEYDESLELLQLSTGKPKTDHSLMSTVYLQTKNNVVSDIIEVETKDLITLAIRLSYKVNFEGDAKRWFNVSNYVKLLTQHTRSMLRNAAKKKTVEDFYNNSTDIIRDTILGDTKEGKRKGREFEENGMKIYDIEVLSISIGDDEISDMMSENQREIIEQNLKLARMSKELEYTKRVEEMNRLKIDERMRTEDKTNQMKLKNIDDEALIETKKTDNEITLSTKKYEFQSELQNKLLEISQKELARERAKEELKFEFEAVRSKLKVSEVEAQMAAIQPGLIEAMVSSNDVNLARVLAENLKQQGSGGVLDAFLGGTSGGFEGFMGAIKGTTLENRITKVMEEYSKMKDKK